MVTFPDRFLKASAKNAISTKDFTRKIIETTTKKSMPGLDKV
jgi:hypothetical protein